MIGHVEHPAGIHTVGLLYFGTFGTNGTFFFSCIFTSRAFRGI